MPDRQGAKPYSLLRAAMQESGRSAPAKWARRAKEYVVQIRPVEGGLVLQQMLYADEVRPIGRSASISSKSALPSCSSRSA